MDFIDGLRRAVPRRSGDGVRTWLTYLLVSAGFVISYGLTVWAKPLFAPDTRYYYAMALRYGGESQDSAAATVAAQSALSGWESPGPDLLFGWGLVQPRVVYPALSTPFVRLFGVDGLAIVSGLALFALVIVMTALMVSRYGATAAVATSLLVLASSQVVFFGAAMLTESLSALWTALIAVVAFRHARDPQRAHLVVLFVLTVVSAFTRQATLIPAGALVVAWAAGFLLHREQRWGGPALVVTATAIGAQVLQTRLFPTFSQQGQFLRVTKTDSLPEALEATPALIWHIVSTNAMKWATTDMAIALIVGLAAVSAVVFWRRAESHLLVGAVLATALYNVTNGTPVGFRYAMPGLVFFALAVAQAVAATARSLSAHPAPSPRKEGTPA